MGGYGRLMRAVRGTLVVREPASLCGHPVRRSKVLLEVLEPCPGPDGDLDLNDNSFVLRVVHGRVRILLAGDLEARGEARLLGLGRSLVSDLVKVPHHGSGTSSTEAFVKATRPRYAAISVGARNHFGHPADVVVSRWRASGARVVRTDVEGGLVFVSDGRRLRSAGATQ